MTIAVAHVVKGIKGPLLLPTEEVRLPDWLGDTLAKLSKSKEVPRLNVVTSETTQRLRVVMENEKLRQENACILQLRRDNGELYEKIVN